MVDVFLFYGLASPVTDRQLVCHDQWLRYSRTVISITGSFPLRVPISIV